MNAYQGFSLDFLCNFVWFQDLLLQYYKQKAKVQKVHTKVYNQRKDYLHKISNEITNQYDIICVETLADK